MPPAGATTLSVPLKIAARIAHVSLSLAPILILSRRLLRASLLVFGKRQIKLLLQLVQIGRTHGTTLATRYDIPNRPIECGDFFLHQ